MSFLAKAEEEPKVVTQNERNKAPPSILSSSNMDDVSNQPLKKKTSTPGKKGKKTTATVGRFIDKFNMHLKTSEIHLDSTDSVNDATTDD